MVVDGNPALQIKHARFTLGPAAVSPLPVGEDVQTDGHAGSGEAYDCKGRFEKFPFTVTR